VGERLYQYIRRYYLKKKEAVGNNVTQLAHFTGYRDIILKKANRNGGEMNSRITPIPTAVLLKRLMAAVRMAAC
jgi:hypothetical protein